MGTNLFDLPAGVGRQGTRSSVRTIAAAPVRYAFYREPRRGYFKNIHLDVLAGVDRVIGDGSRRPDRLAIMGLRAGGHLGNNSSLCTVAQAASSYAGGGLDFVVRQFGYARRSRPLAGGTSLPRCAFQTYLNIRRSSTSPQRTPTIFFIVGRHPCTHAQSGK